MTTLPLKESVVKHIPPAYSNPGVPTSRRGQARIKIVISCLDAYYEIVIPSGRARENTRTRSFGRESGKLSICWA